MNPQDIITLISGTTRAPLDDIVGQERAALLRRSAVSTGLVPEEDLVLIANTVALLRPASSLEIGLASGSTAVTIMASKPQDGSRTHIALDPFQTQYFGDRGTALIQEASLAEGFRLIQEPSYAALPALLASSVDRYDFIYIDGNHMFDHTMLEWFYCDKLLKTGGVIGFDDCNWPMVRSVVNFVEANCAYSFVKPNDRTWFAVKLGDDARAWFHFKPFEVAWGGHYQAMVEHAGTVAASQANATA